MDAFIGDIRFALRSLTRRPGLTLASVASLGLALAACTAVFSVVNAALFKPIAGVNRTERLVEVARLVGSESTDVTWQVFAGLREQRGILDDLAAFHLTQVSIQGSGEPVMRGALAVTANYFDLLGTGTTLGRTFAADEASFPAVAPVVVISHDAWRRELAADSTVIGRAVRVNGVPVTVIGVLQEGFSGHHTALLQDVFLPLGLEMPGLPSPAALRGNNTSSLELIGRLAAGVQPATAARELALVADAADREGSTAQRPPYAVSVLSWGPLPGTVRGAVAVFFSVLLGLVGLALAMACVNVTTIVLARTLDRQRELAVRRAIGATRGRVVSQVVTEVVVLFALAGVAGAALSTWATGLLNFAPPVPVPGRLGADFAPDARVFLFALTVTFGAALAFSLLPALRASRFDISAALREGGASDTRARSRLRGALVGVQLAFTAVLLVATTLFGRALDAVRASQPSWNLDGVLVASLELELTGTEVEAGRTFQRTVRERLAGLPGVEAVAFAAKLPIGGRSFFGEAFRSGVEPVIGAGSNASVNRTTPGYFDAMQLPLRGRDFSDADQAGTPAVAIVNETMARELWPNEEPVGRRFFVGSGTPRQEFDVIGVTGDARLTMPGRASEPQYYLPQSQYYTSASVLHVRATPALAASVAAAARAVVREAMPSLPIPVLRPMTEALDVYLLPQRVATWVSASMGLFGIILAAVGVYGVSAYAVSRRGREIAIRMALGASARSVAALVVRQGVRAPIVGIVAGLAVGAALATVVARLGVIPGVRPADPVVLLAAPLALVTVTVAAMAGPIRRALRRPTMTVLREE
jgi:predicted permease